MAKKLLKKRVNKPKEQITREMKLMEEATRQKKIVREILFPILAEHAKTIQHAQQSCEIMKAVIMQAMQLPYKDATVAILNLDKELTKEENVPDRAMFEAFNEGLKDIAITDVLKVLEGMGGAIDGFVRNEAAKKPFDLKVDDLVN